jgi:hypothetical protein
VAYRRSPICIVIFNFRSKEMNTTKFWITAASTVATAGMIGAAIAQTVTPAPSAQTPVPSAEQSATTAPAAGSESMAQAQTGSSSTDTASSAAEAPMAQADRG